jgi:predicted dienelactone hydrolase
MCKHRAVAVVLLTLVCAAAVADARTPFNVGFRQFELNDTITGETYPVAVWFPTRAPAGSTTIGPFVLAATRNAEPADGRFGLILISHGSGGSELNHRDLGSALAKRGYIVAAPRHPRDNFKDHSGRGALEVWVGRPKQLSQVIDRILADEQLGPRVDASRIGTVGHSSGGYTALALAGAPPSMQALLRHCREVPDDSGFCAYGGSPAVRRHAGVAIFRTSLIRVCAPSLRWRRTARSLPTRRLRESRFQRASTVRGWMKSPRCASKPRGSRKSWPAGPITSNSRTPVTTPSSRVSPNRFEIRLAKQRWIRPVLIATRCMRHSTPR